MDLLFVLVAVCPAVILAKYDLKESGFSWKEFLSKFAGWFYGITFINIVRMYLQGMGSFDFSVLSVAFLTEYMLSSMAVVIFVQIVRGIRHDSSCEEESRKGGDHDC